MDYKAVGLCGEWVPDACKGSDSCFTTGCLVCVLVCGVSGCCLNALGNVCLLGVAFYRCFEV